MMGNQCLGKFGVFDEVANAVRPIGKEAEDFEFTRDGRDLQLFEYALSYLCFLARFILAAAPLI